MANRELTKIYELVLNGPGMSEEFKLSFPVSRRHLLLFCLLVENEINPVKERAEELATLLSAETRQELTGLIPEILKKGGPGLYEFYERLKTYRFIPFMQMTRILVKSASRALFGTSCVSASPFSITTSPSKHLSYLK
ncbi:MAG TPA: hypothetical protein VG101_13000 [Puia sp.]|jgi:hypothetical protein|nr:hypothetical protein [Puia sp.]